MSSGIPKEVIDEKAKGLIHEYKGKYLADESLKNREVLLLSLYLINSKNDEAYSDYGEVRNLFTELGRKKQNFNGVLSRAVKKKLIEKKNRKLSFLSGGLKNIRSLLGKTEKAPVHVIEGGQNLSAIKLFEDFLNAEIENKELLLCDPHISYSTLYPFTVIKDTLNELKIITYRIHENKQKLKDYKEKLEKEGNMDIEIKRSYEIHDRYLINGDVCWSIGTSIKDLGNKDTMIKDISQVSESLRNLFLDRWEESENVFT